MEYTSIVHGKKSQCCEPLVVEGWVPIAVFSLVVTGTRSTGVLTGEGRAELAADGNIGREALRRCKVLIGNFVLPNNMSKKRGEELRKGNTPAGGTHWDRLTEDYGRRVGHGENMG